jgi:hypothetical protein
MKTAGICLTFIYLASLGGYIAVVLECEQCLVFYGDLMDDGSVIAKYETNGMVSILMFLAKVRSMVVFQAWWAMMWVCSRGSALLLRTV